jgi:hypothetical protein
MTEMDSSVVTRDVVDELVDESGEQLLTIFS